MVMTKAIQSLGGGGTLPKPILFQFDTVSPLTLFNLIASDTIDKVEVCITEAFDDSAATLEVGTVGNPSLIFSSSQINPQKVGDYVCDQNFLITVAEVLRLTINPGTSTQGKGFVVITIRR